MKTKVSCFSWIILAALFFLSIARPVQATPPLDVALNYSWKDELLEVKIKHPSHNLDHHFIRKIILYKNDAEAEIKHFRRQSDPYAFTVEFTISAKPGDTLKAIAFCEKGGSKEGTLLIEEEAGSYSSSHL